MEEWEGKERARWLNRDTLPAQEYSTLSLQYTLQLPSEVNPPAFPTMRCHSPPTPATCVCVCVCVTTFLWHSCAERRGSELCCRETDVQIQLRTSLGKALIYSEEEEEGAALSPSITSHCELFWLGNSNFGKSQCKSAGKSHLFNNGFLEKHPLVATVSSCSSSAIPSLGADSKFWTAEFS